LPGSDATHGAEDDLDQLIRRVDPDRWLTSRFIADKRARTDVLALYAFDHELARARRAASTQLLAEIRLTWWREALEEIFAGGPVRRHPVASALGDLVRRHGLPRTPLEAMIDGQIAALDIELGEAESLAWADAVEGSLAMVAASVLDPFRPERAAFAGRAWGLVLLLRSGRAPDARLRPLLASAIAEARAEAAGLSVAAMPAALPVRLARFDLAGRRPGVLRKQLSLILASATGRL
jgi:phytoene synthase